MEIRNSDNEKDNFNLFWILLIIVILIYASLVLSNFKDKNSTFSDLYNSINTLFSGIAMCGVFYTIFLQKKELSLQRRELKDTRREFEIQNETLKKQRFENTFFQLLNLHHEIVRNLEVDNKSEREVFVKFINDLENTIGKDYFTYETPQIDLTKGIFARATNFSLDVYEDGLIKGYKKNFDQLYENILGHYFRHLYQIYKLVYMSNLIPETDKEFYASIVTAQLSSKELTAIFYNSLIKGFGNPNFLFLVKNFGLIDYLNKKEILDERHLAIYHNYIQDLKDPFVK